MWKLWIIILFAIALPAFGDQIRNGSFESGKDGQKPTAWNFSTHNGAKCTMQVSDKQACSGKQSLKVVNKSGLQAHVYGSIVQYVKLQPGRRYKLSCYVKGKNVNRLMLIVGKKWQQRFIFNHVNDKWKKYEFVFQAQSDQFSSNGTYMVRLISDNLVKEAYVDNMKIEPVGSVNVNKSQENRLYVMKRLAGDLSKSTGIPSDCQTYTVPLNASFFQGKFPAKKDFNARIAWAWDDKGLIFIAKVDDDKIKTFSKSAMWKGDSIQLRIDQLGTMGSGDKPSDLEFGFAPSEQGMKSWCWKWNRTLNKDEAEIHGGVIKGGYFLVARIFWSTLKKIDFSNKHNFSANVVVNECDQPGTREVAFLAPGIHISKSSEHNTLMMFDTGKPALETIGTISCDRNAIKGKIVVRGVNFIKPWQIKAILTDADGKKHQFFSPGTTPLRNSEMAVININYPVSKVAEGKFSLKLTIPGAECIVNSTKIDLLKKQRGILARADRDLRELAQEIKTTHYADSLYLTAPLQLLRQQVAIHKKDLSNATNAETLAFYTNRGENTCFEIKEGVKYLRNQLKLAKAGKLPTTCWQYISSPEKLRNGWLYADCIDDLGKNHKRRPVMFVGYGHFDTVIRDIELFHKISANIIQIEIGPHHLFSKLDKDGKIVDLKIAKFKSYILGTLKKAWKNNVKVSILLSPHYFPKAIIKLYPEMKLKSGMLKYEVNHPEARKVIKAYLETVIPLLKNSPWKDAIHSICLSNEAIYSGAIPENPYIAKLFTAYMEKKFGSISDFNRISGCQFKSFSGILPKYKDLPAIKYEFNLFKRESFAGWHKWMAGIIRNIWPQVPLHAKIMVFDSLKASTVDFAADPELFAELSDLNGNDNYMLYDHENKTSKWSKMAMYHDLQRSMKKTQIANTENHMIKDEECSYIPFGHIYTSIFQQFMYGVGTIISWVWQDIDYTMYNKIKPLRRNIYRRPMNLIAQSKATLDGNRLAKEIIAFCDVEPKVKIIYSPASYIQNTDKYCLEVRELYNSLSFCGNKLGFISEKQLEAGDFKQTRIIFAPSVKYIRKAAIKELKKFVKNGGKVITIGECFKFDRFGNPLGMKIKNVNLPDNLVGSSYVKALKKHIYKVTRPKIMVLFNGKPETYGLLWRGAETPHGYLVNLVNYTKKPGRISFPQSVKAVDLISGRNVSDGTKINSLEPMLIKVEFQ